MSGSAADPLNIFNQPTAVAGSAANMSVVMTDPNQIAAAVAGQGTGDNSNATAMANLANQPIVNGLIRQPTSTRIWFPRWGRPFPACRRRTRRKMRQ